MIPTRRHFLQSALGAPLTTRLGELVGLTQPILGTPNVLRSQELFDNPHIIRYDASCFTLRGVDTFIVSGAFHYPRCPKSLWRDRLIKFKRAGFNTIETYVFWNYHEPEEGRVDLSEFEEFIGLVKQMGLWMIARPGPYVCAEWDAGGFPHWVVAKRFPLRSNHPESLKTSDHWFSQVLPVIQRHQILLGGPIILMQIENEYDYWNLPDAEKRQYIRALAQMAWQAGINIPLITCWTRQSRDRTDADFARLADTCNFYPRWNITEEVPPALKKLRQEEPASPLGVMELQGGWFSQFGGKASVEQDGVSGAQLELLTKTVIEQGVTYFNYYMGFGGTNFDWAAKSLTTTYDYAAPIREPGGLWEKYYAARGIGLFLERFGATLARAQAVEDGAQSTNASVSATQRVNARSGVLFLRQNANGEQRFKLSFHDPNSPTRRLIIAPREGELVLGQREMKMLPVQVPIAGGQLRYSTAEVLAYGLNLDRHFLIVYDEPGRLVEIGLATEREPSIEGEPLYQYWDEDYDSVVFGFRVEKSERIFLVNDHLLVVALPRQRALRTWIAEYSPQIIPGAEERHAMQVPFLGDAALLAASGNYKSRLWVELEFLPGEHDLTALLPPKPAKCRIDGVLTDFQYDRKWRTARAHVTTPACPASPKAITEIAAWVEKFSGQPGGEWVNSTLRPLEELGTIPYGYVKYRIDQATYRGEAGMFISSFADDNKQVFINSRYVPELSKPAKQVEVELAKYAQGGIQSLEISYELFGSPNFGENIGELKGIESVRLGSNASHGAPIERWQIQRFSRAMRGRGIDPELANGGWSSATVGGAAGSKEFVPAFTWCRAEFVMEKLPEAWTVPFKLSIEAERDALLYLNGKFVGRYVTVGPQRDFYLPDPYLLFDPKRKNILTVVLAYTDQPGHLRSLRVAPYEEFAVRRTRVEFEW